MPFHSDKLLLKSEKRLYFRDSDRKSPLVVLCYPNTYEVGMSSLAFHFLLRVFRSSRLRVERVFALPQIRSAKAGTLESGCSIKKASVILATISFEEDYMNLVQLLKYAGIEIEKSKRSAPLIISGGGAVSANPAMALHFSDCVALGEFDEIGSFLASTVETCALGGGSKQRALDTLSGHPNFLVTRVERAGGKHLAKTGKHYVPVSSEVITPFSHFSDTVLIDINRACVSSCKFCMASYVHRPFRTASSESILEIAEKWRGKAKAIGLVGTAVTSHPDFRSICEKIRSLGFVVRLSSLRLEDLSLDTLRFLSDLGVRSITLAPETASDALRSRLGKPVSNERIMQIMEGIAGLSIRKIKLYFMYGIPGESEEDVRGIVLQTAAIRKQLRNKRISFSVNCLIPKAWTPFQWVALPPRNVIEERRRLLIRLARREMKVTPILASYGSIAVQAALSIGDANLAKAFDAFDGSKASILREWKNMGIELDEIIHREKQYNHRFPWDEIHSGIDRRKLYEEFKELMGEEDQK